MDGHRLDSRYVITSILIMVSERKGHRDLRQMKVSINDVNISDQSSSRSGHKFDNESSETLQKKTLISGTDGSKNLE